MTEPILAFGSRAHLRLVAVLALPLLVLAVPNGAAAAPRKPAITYVACIELTGQPPTFRDLKLRQGPCHKNERRIAWPPTGTGAFQPPTVRTGPTGPTGPVGPRGATGAVGPT